MKISYWTKNTLRRQKKIRIAQVLLSSILIHKRGCLRLHKIIQIMWRELNWFWSLTVLHRSIWKVGCVIRKNEKQKKMKYWVTMKKAIWKSEMHYYTKAANKVREHRLRCIVLVLKSNRIMPTTLMTKTNTIVATKFWISKRVTRSCRWLRRQELWLYFLSPQPPSNIVSLTVKTISPSRILVTIQKRAQQFTRRPNCKINM